MTNSWILDGQKVGSVPEGSGSELLVELEPKDNGLDGLYVTSYGSTSSIYYIYSFYGQWTPTVKFNDQNLWANDQFTAPEDGNYLFTCGPVGAFDWSDTDYRNQLVYSLVARINDIRYSVQVPSHPITSGTDLATYDARSFFPAFSFTVSLEEGDVVSFGTYAPVGRNRSITHSTASLTAWSSVHGGGVNKHSEGVTRLRIFKV